MIVAQTSHRTAAKMVSWRWRPAGGFSDVRGDQKRRRDAGATKTCAFCSLTISIPRIGVVPRKSG